MLAVVLRTGYQVSGVWIVGIAALPERSVDDRRKACQGNSLLQLWSWLFSRSDI